jgi:hypothetical protein
MTLYFKPYPQGFKDRMLRVSPDILPPGSVGISSVEIDGKPYSDFDANGLFVRLPQSNERVKVKVTIVPTSR